MTFVNCIGYFDKPVLFQQQPGRGEKEGKNCLTTVNNTLSSFLPTPPLCPCLFLTCSLWCIQALLWFHIHSVSVAQGLLALATFGRNGFSEKIFPSLVFRYQSNQSLCPFSLQIFYTVGLNPSQFHYPDLFLTSRHTQEEGTMHAFDKVVQLVHKYN